VTHYSQAAEFYDLLYQDEKDYPAEAALLASSIRALHPDATTLLDVGCGTGSHARALIDAGFAVDGVDLEPAFVELARAKCPEGEFFVGDMRTLDVPGRYDVVTSLFSAIGYVEDEAGLRRAIAGMRAALNPGGVLIVDPWFEPGQLTHGWISVLVGVAEDVTVCRMARTLVEGTKSRLEFEYLIGRSTGIERRRETHTLGLFTQSQIEAAFTGAGLPVTRKPAALRTRGLYVGHDAKHALRGTKA
jgi:SAM-dependent methyltransferase